MNRMLTFCAGLCLSLCFSLLPLALLSSAQTFTGTPATTTARYAYDVEANIGQNGGVLVGYSMNPATGNLRPLESFALPSDNFGIVVDPSNKFLYIPDGPQILGYRIGANGLLQALKGSPFNLIGGSTMVFTPSGKFAYSNFATEYSLNSTTGTLTQIGTATVSANPVDIAINPAGTLVYILNASQATISAFSVDQSSGVLTEIAGSPFAAGELRVDSEVVSPDGKFLFVARQPTNVATDGTTAVFTIDATTGALTTVAGSPFPTPGGGNGIVVDPASQFLYIAGNNLGAYSINGTTGALTAITGSPYSLPAVANGMTIDPTGKFLYISLYAVAGPPGVLRYSINSSTGAATRIAADGDNGNQVEGLAIASGSQAVFYTPKFAYVTNQGDKTVSEWTINNTTGALTAVTGSPISDTNGPQSIAAAPSGAFVYTGNSNNSVSEYSVSASTGALTPVSGSPVKGFGSVNALAVDSTSSFLLVLDSTKQVVDSYAINAKTGALTLFSSAAAPAQAQTLTLDPTGALAVTSAAGVQTYRVTDGALLGMGSGTTASLPTAAIVDQSSQYVFVTEPNGNAVVTFNLFSHNGALSQLSSAATGNGPGAVVAEPSGKYVYVANTGDGTISVYSVKNSTGALTKIGSAVTAAAGTDSLNTSNDGKYLYATDRTAGLVSIFKINSTGTLTPVGTATTGAFPASIVTTGTHH